MSNNYDVNDFDFALWLKGLVDMADENTNDHLVGVVKATLEDALTHQKADVLSDIRERFKKGVTQEIFDALNRNDPSVFGMVPMIDLSFMKMATKETIDTTMNYVKDVISYAFGRPIFQQVVASENNGQSRGLGDMILDDPETNVLFRGVINMIGKNLDQDKLNQGFLTALSSGKADDFAKEVMGTLFKDPDVMGMIARSKLQ